MTSQEINTAFLSRISPVTRRDILAAIATHYDITPDEAFAEVTAPEAEHLADYLTGSMQTAVLFLVARYDLSPQ